MAKKDIPNNNLESTPGSGAPWYKKKKIVIPLVLFVLLVGAGSGGGSEESSSISESANSTDPLSASTPQTPTEVKPAAGEFGAYPEDQAKFLNVIEQAKGEIESAETDLQKSVAIRNRDKQLCAVLTGNKVVNWSGVIKNIGANSEGKAYLDIEIADRIRVQTWNNAFSDISDNTLIPTSSNFFDDLVAMGKGDLVTFSANFLKGSNSCLKKGNFTEVFYGVSPEFIVRFSSVSKN